MSLPSGRTGGAVSLPLPGQQARTFAHPAEAMLGELLTFYRVRWVYEPTSFVLKRTEDGTIAESFTPDFYLPDHRVYLELTTMRQPLVTRKNGKIRRLRELFPTVRIKTLYRRDYDRIVQTSELIAPRAPRAGQLVFDAAQIHARTQALAAEIRCSLGEAGLRSMPLVLMTVRNEAEPFQRLLGAALASLDIPVVFDRIELSRFKIDAALRRVCLVQRPSVLSEGRAVLLVAGATSTGLSLDFALGHLRGQRPSWLETASLLDRQTARVVDAPVRFGGFEAPPDILTGFGLSAWPHDALPAILKDGSCESPRAAAIEL